MKKLLLAILVFGTTSALAGSTNDIVCTIDLCSSTTQVTKLNNTYMYTLAESHGYIVKNLTTDLFPNTISFGIFGPKDFQLNVDLVVTDKNQYPRVSLWKGSALGEIHITCSQP